MEAAAVDVCLAAVGRLSPRRRVSIGRALGTVFWAVDARHRRNAQRSIALAFGDALPRRDVHRLTLASMRHYTRVMVEATAFREFQPDDVRAEGLEHLRTALDKGRGLLGFSGHLGNWELLHLALGHHGLPSLAVVRPLDNPRLEKRLENLRGLGGNGIVARRGAVSSVLKLLREGRFVTMLIDQRSEDSGIPVSFLGRRAFAADALAVLALRTGAPIVPGFAVLEPDGSWHVVIEPEVPVVASGDLHADIQRVMTDCTAILERWVRRYPEQWLWTHAKLKP
jgi:KDO2-lipid IV(A) lauroyltransferase